MRHLDVKHLWLQREVADGRVIVRKVKGTENAADIMTKVLSLREIEERLWRMGIAMI